MGTKISLGKGRPGDLILEINGARIRNKDDFYFRLVASAAVNETKLRMFRRNSSWVVTFPAIPRTKRETD